MKNASRGVLLGAMILSIVLAVTYGVCSCIFFVLYSLPAVKEELIEGFANDQIKSDFPGTPEQRATAMLIMFLALAIVFLFLAVFNIISAVSSQRARTYFTKKDHIINIVFSVLSNTYVGLVGSIFGLIVLTKEENRIE